MDEGGWFPGLRKHLANFFHVVLAIVIDGIVIIVFLIKVEVILLDLLIGID